MHNIAIGEHTCKVNSDAIVIQKATEQVATSVVTHGTSLNQARIEASATLTRDQLRLLPTAHSMASSVGRKRRAELPPICIAYCIRCNLYCLTS